MIEPNYLTTTRFARPAIRISLATGWYVTLFLRITIGCPYVTLFCLYASFSSALLITITFRSSLPHT